MKFPHPRILRGYSWIVVVTWVTAVAAAVNLVLTVIAGVPLYGVAAVLVLSLVAALYLLISFPWLRCPACQRVVTLQVGRSAHPSAAANNLGQIGGWSALVVSSLRKQTVVCIHCGSALTLEGDRAAH